MKLTSIQAKALKWLSERNGSGTLDRHGRLLAGGEIIGTYCGDDLVEAVGSLTWLRLTALGLTESDGPNRLRISTAGYAQLGKGA